MYRKVMLLFYKINYFIKVLMSSICDIQYYTIFPDKT